MSSLSILSDALAPARRKELTIVLDKQKAEAQQAVDELLKEGLLPFKLNVGKVTSESAGDYRVHFYDGRLHSVTVTFEPDQPFKDLVRTAVLDRLSKWSGPLQQ